jgi:PadR family transcriptional regulator PadR
MLMNDQYKKGVVELCVLCLLNRGDTYGYDVSDYLSKHMDISDGAVYPMLRKLKDDGLVTTYLSETSGGPPRKYYAITSLGKEEYAKSRQDWLSFAEAIKNILEDDQNG